MPPRSWGNLKTGSTGRVGPGRRSTVGDRGELSDQHRRNRPGPLPSPSIHRLVQAHHPLDARARLPDRDPVKKGGSHPGDSALIALSCLLILVRTCMNEADDQVAFPGAGDSPVVDLGWAGADHDVRGDRAATAVAGPGARLGQRPPCAQALRQLPVLHTGAAHRGRAHATVGRSSRERSASSCHRGSRSVTGWRSGQGAMKPPSDGGEVVESRRSRR